MQARRIYQFREIIIVNNLLAAPGDSLGRLTKLKTAFQSAKKLTFFVPMAVYARTNHNPQATSPLLSLFKNSDQSSAKQNIRLIVNGQPIAVPKNGTTHTTISDDRASTTVDIYAAQQDDGKNHLNNSVELHINTTEAQSGGSHYIET